MDKKGQNYNSIDVMKLVMVLIVAAIHTDPLFECYDWRVQYVFAYMKLLAVPFFFIATGYLTGVRGAGLDVIKKRLIKTIQSYLLASLVYLPLAIAKYRFDGKSLRFGILHYIRGLVLKGEHFNSWILWYLLAAAFGLTVIYFCEKKAWNRKKYIPILIVIGIVFSILLDTLGSIQTQLPFVLDKLRMLLDVTLEDGRLFKGIIYIPLGMLMAEMSVGTEQKKKQQICILSALFIAGFAMIILTYGSMFINVSIAVCSAGLFGLVVNIHLKDAKIYKYIRSLSSSIYFCHMWVWTIYYYYRYSYSLCIPRKGLDSYLVAVIGSMVIGTGYYCIVQGIKNKKEKKCNYENH